MNACLGPRTLTWGGDAMSRFASYPHYHKNSGRFISCRKIQRRPSGLEVPPEFFSFTSSVDGEFVKTRHTTDQLGYKGNQAATIYVTILGGNGCTLCSKAALAVRRIVASLAPLLHYRTHQLHPGKYRPSQGLVANTPGCTGLGKQKISQRGEGITADNNEDSSKSVVLTSQGGGVVVPPRPDSGQPDLVFFHICQVGRQGTGEIEVLEEKNGQQPAINGQQPAINGQQPASSTVAVQVKEVNLDCPSEWKQLGLNELKASALRTNVPVVVIGGRQVCSLKFNGPLVRSALLKQLSEFHQKSEP